MPLKSALLRDFGGCCFCNTIRACFLWLLEVTIGDFNGITYGVFYAGSTFVVLFCQFQIVHVCLSVNVTALPFTRRDTFISPDA